jgi:hypothetical protein
MENHHMGKGAIKSTSVFLANRWQNGRPATNEQVKVHVGITRAEELTPSKKDCMSYVTDTKKVPDHSDGNQI